VTGQDGGSTVFTTDAQSVIDKAKDIAVSLGEGQLTLKAIITSIAIDGRGMPLLSQCLNLDASELGQHFPPPHPLQQCQAKLPLSQAVREMLATAKDLVARFTLPNHPSLIALPHLVVAVVRSLNAERSSGIALQNITLPTKDELLTLLAVWIEDSTKPPSLGDLTRRLRGLRSDLLGQVYGQDQAIQQFIDGLFNTEVVAAVDAERRGPSGLFVFAGPPGVGKTYLAELGASHLDRPFKRFDMSTYAHGHETASLIGTSRVYQGAQPGTLTDFVQRNPTAVLLFDEIEKAHATAIQLFLQILDAGLLQDKYTEQDVEFRDTILIFTTNVGRTLYDNENASGVHQANAVFHRNTILDAMRSEVNPKTREPFFPASICSRLATGFPVLFNHLLVEDLAHIARTELRRVSGLLAKGHNQRYVLADEIPLAVVMREGAQVDARTIKSQAEAFLKQEIFKACQLFADDRVDAATAGIEDIRVEIDEEHAGDMAMRLFSHNHRPIVLFVGETLLGHFYSQVMPQVEWLVASSGDHVFDLLTTRSVDFVLLDLGMQPASAIQYADLNEAFRDVPQPLGADTTVLNFDYSPLAARRFRAGQQLLEQLRVRMPEIPVYLFSLEDDRGGLGQSGVDEELLVACVRAGGARGMIRTSLGSREATDYDSQCEALQREIESVGDRLRMERMAAELARQNQVIVFDTAPALDEDNKHLRIRCRNFRLARAIRSADISALVSDAERPTIRFDDVIGAAGAKEAMFRLGAWLREPKKFAAAGVEPPAGVLLTGPPGTGKTMLARALAGESDCPFLVESATNFVTIWQGSGPENVRNLFVRARRYAPSIVFIDEIDAVGRKRSGAPGAGHGEEMALNALLTEMDGFSKPTSRPVIVIAATNQVDILDPALKRRFSRVIEVELPTRAERELYIQKRLAAKPVCAATLQMIERLAAQGARMSIADLERILAEASLMSLQNNGVIDDAILGEAFEKVTMGESKAGADILRTARHEAGHGLIMCLMGKPPIYVTVVGRGSFGGYAAVDNSDERRSQTKTELEDVISQVLGGREAERLYYGDGLGESTGPSNDLEHATNIAEAMVYDLGMAEEIGFVRIDRRRPQPGEISDRCYAAVRRIIDAQSQRTKLLLSDHRQTLDRIAEALIQQNRLLKHEILELLTTEEKQLATAPRLMTTESANEE
jgi:ATP-dependent metalloprotease FtsH